MRMVIVALGTRGDVQPALALGKGLKAAGHSVVLVAGGNFENWVRGHGLDFAGMFDMEALMKSPEGVAWVEEPNPLRQLGHMKSLLRKYSERMYPAIVEQGKDADLLVSGFVSEPFTQAVSEKFGVPQIVTLLQPYRPTRSGAASLSPIIPNRNSLLNFWSGKLGEMMIWRVAGETTNQFRTQVLQLPPHTRSSYTKASYRTPVIHGFSPHVVPPPADWGDSAYTSGYWFLDEAQDWQPPNELTRFLEAGTTPLYFGFGSMASGSPQQTVDLIAAALENTEQRGIIASGWSDMVGGNLPEHVFAIDRAPHDWLFARVAGVVHHGGAGTTAAGLRAGKPTLIIPHMSDQPFWGRRVYELGVGAKPIPRHRVTVENLAAGIQMLVNDANIQANAARLGKQIRAERGVENAVEWIERLAGEPRH